MRTVRNTKPAAEAATPSLRSPSFAIRYGLAIVSFAVALGVGLLARHYGIGHQFAMLLFAIAVAGWNGGLGPAILAAVLSSLSYDYFITEPLYTLGFTKYDAIDIGLYLSFAVLIARFREIRWRTERKLRTSEQKYRQLIDTSPDAVFVLDKAGKCVLGNAAAARLYGCTQNELIGLPLADTCLPTERPLLQERIQRAGHQSALRFERQFLRKDNQTVLVEVSLSAAGEDQYQELVRDITERKEAEEKFRLAVEASPSGIVLVNREGNIALANTQTERMFGYDRDELMGKPVEMLLPERFASEHSAYRAKFLAAPEARAMGAGRDLFARRRDGSEFPVEIGLNPIQIPKGLLVLANVVDITERKRAEQQLRKQAELLSLAHDAIIVRDTKGQIKFWNRGAEKTYGWTAAEAIGRIMHHLLQTKFPASLSALETTLEEQGEWEGELVHTARGGRKIIVTSRQSLRRDEHNTPAAVMEINRDVTERKHAEEEIHKLNQELEQRVIERTGELQAVNKELEAFAYSVSHDLRAPVRHIAGFTELLEKHSGQFFDEKGLHYTQQILDSANRMGTLVDDLLAFSRIGRAETQQTLVNLEQLVKSVVGEIAPDTQGRKISWLIGHLPICYGDPAMLRLVFGNLISNAVKFTRTREEARIEIGFLNHASDEIVAFTKDNGVGFDMKYKDKLFGVFQRLHSQEAFEGTGIGLATVQRIVHRHGGRVWAEGSLDRGATFYVALPKTGELKT